MADQNKCAHAGCNCTVKDGEKYCSPTCQSAGEKADIACQCGHSGCVGTGVRH